MEGKKDFPTRAREAYRLMLDEVQALSASQEVEALAVAKIQDLTNQFIGVDVAELTQELIGLYKEGRRTRRV